MSFEIKWFPKASQNLSKLPKFQIERIFKKLDRKYLKLQKKL